MTAPAVLAAIPLLLGVLCGALAELRPGQAAMATVVAVALTTLALHRRLTIGWMAAMAGAFWCIGVWAGAAAHDAASHPLILSWRAEHGDDAPARMRGVLRADAASTGASVGLVLDVAEVDGTPSRGGVRLSVGGALARDAAAGWRAGRAVTVTASVHLPVDFRDPGVASDRVRLMRQDIALIGSIKSAALVNVSARGSLLQERASALRGYVRRATAAAVGRWDAQAAGVVTAILIGDRSGLDLEAERRMQEAGTYHVIAISGGNIALLTALLVAAGRLARVPARGTAAGAIVLLAFYGYVAGLAPSVLRATLAAGVFLAARAMDHRGSALNALAVAAGVAAIAAPLTILDPGFVLSFGATTAIIVGAGRLAGAPGRDHDARGWRRQIHAVIRASAMLLAATLCAEIALAPISALLFGRISFAGLLLNFIAIPLMSLIEVGGFVVVALSLVSPPAAAACGWVVQLATRLMLWSAGLVDVAPWLVRDVPPPAFWLLASWYLAWAVMLTTARRALRRTATGVSIATGLIMLAGYPATRAVRVPAPPAGWSRIVFIDVGQGDATLIQPWGSDPLLVDAGGLAGSGFDVGRRVTLPAAWAFGVTRLATLVLTHGDPDHIGGAPPVIRALAPREIWDGITVPRHEPMETLRDLALRNGIGWVPRRTGDAVIAGAASIRILNPPEPDWERQKVRNDDSVVLEVRVGDVRFVLPGDITGAAEPRVAAAAEPARVTVLKAPHHGSGGSSTPAFIGAMRPDVVVFSAGRRNPFGHPAPAVVARYRAAGAHVFSTGDDGAIVIDTDGRELRIFTSAFGWTKRH